MVGLSTVLQVAAFTLLMTWTVGYGKRMRRLGRALIADRKVPSSRSSQHQVTSGMRAAGSSSGQPRSKLSRDPLAQSGE